MQQNKSDSDADEDLELNLPIGLSVEVPVRLSLEEQFAQFEPFRLYWMEHFYDPEVRLKSKNPNRFEM